MLPPAKVGTFLDMRKFFSKKKLQGYAQPAPLRDRACSASLQALMHYVPFHVEHIFYACSTSLQALMHSVPQPTPLRDRACYASLQALMHSVPQPAPLRDRACYASLPALMHSVPQPTPLRAPPIALHSTGVPRLKITPAFAGAMRMGAKPPLSLPWRGLSPRGRDTPASLRAGRAGARPREGAPLRRQRHYAHEHLPLRSACTIAPLRRQRHYAHEHLPLRSASIKDMFHVEQHFTHEHLPLRSACIKDMFHVEQHFTHEHLPLRSACTIAPLCRQGIALKSAHIKESTYLRGWQHVVCAASDCQTIKNLLQWQYFKTCGFAEQRRSSEARCCTPREAAHCRGNWLQKSRTQRPQHRWGSVSSGRTWWRFTEPTQGGCPKRSRTRRQHKATTTSS